jgi:hypothetical protein
MKTPQARNVVGEFTDERSARAAVRFLEHAGFQPDKVAVVSGNVRQAREMTGSRSIPGALIGAAVAVALYAALIIVGGPAMQQNWVALVLGLIGLLPAGIGIGVLAGRSRLFVAQRAERYENAEEVGDTLVSVHVDEAGHERARRLLREAGAVRIREEETIEAA